MPKHPIVEPKIRLTYDCPNCNMITYYDDVDESLTMLLDEVQITCIECKEPFFIKNFENL
jgi:hypothetical protein